MKKEEENLILDEILNLILEILKFSKNEKKRIKVMILSEKEYSRID